MVFFSSMGGQYVVQVLAHTALAALAIEVLLKAWRIARPGTRVQFRMLYLLLPLFGWPVYQLVWPARGSAEFRDTLAIIDTQLWLSLPSAGLPVWGWVTVVMGLGTALFLARAVVPTGRRHLLGGAGREVALAEPLASKLQSSLRGLDNLSASDALVVDEPWPAAYLSGVRRPRLTVSAPLVELLDEEELATVLAHEEAHALHRDNLRGWALFLLGLPMFYNPVTLAALQRMSEDMEMACDDAAAVRTGRPLALASALIKTGRWNTSTSWENSPRTPARWLSRQDARIRRGLVVRRVRRLADFRDQKEVPLKRLKLSLTVLLIATLLFFVV